GGRATDDAWTGPLGGPGGGAARHGGGVRLDAALPRSRVVGVQPDRGGHHPGRPGRAATGLGTTSTRTDRRSPVADGCTWEGTPSVASSISHLFAVQDSDGATLWAVPCHQPGGGSCGPTRRAPSSPIATRPS